jgi:GH24 family phage-related lysozyme (muramidase)
MVFNPDAGGVPSPNMPDQTGASRGSTPNRSWEALFSGLGDAVTGVTQAVDRGIKESISFDANNIFTEAQKPYDVPPADLSKGTESIRTLQAAWDQGKLSDVHYYGLLATQTKNLRAKYPGYEEFVDATIQEVTGVRPANAYRNAIVSELNAQEAAVQDTEKAWRSYENSNQDTIAFLYPDYFNQPDKYNRDEVRAGVARYLGVKNNDSYLKDISQENVYATSTASLALDVDTTISNLGNMLGFGDKNIYQILNDAAKTPMTEEQTLMLASQLQNVIDRTTDSIDRQMITNRSTDTQPMSWFSILGESKASEVKKQVLAPLVRIQQYISEGNFTMAAYASKLTSAQKNDDVRRLLEGPAGPQLRAQMAADSIDPELFQTWVATQNGQRDTAYSAAIPELMAQIATGDRNTNAVATAIAEDTKVSEADRAGALNSLITNVGKTLGAGTSATPEQIEKVVQNTYNLQDGKDVFSLVEDEDYMKVYTMLFDQSVTQNLRATATPETWKLYQDAAVERFQTVPEFRNAAATLNDVITKMPSLKATLDSNGQLVVSATGGFENLTDPMARLMMKNTLESTQNTVNVLNHAFRLLDPILLAEGASTEDKLKIRESLLDSLKVNLSAGKEGTIFDWFKGLFNAQTVENKATDTMQFDLSDIDYAIPGQEVTQTAALTGNTIVDTIIGFEGFRNSPYWDTNALRTGYGSDTVTLADGSYQTVGRGTTVTREDAARDLNRRLTTEFIPEIIEDVGNDTWSSLNERQQAALASIAYNYGSLPSRVIKAVKSGDVDKMAAAIEALQSHNGGVNRKRRLAEASMVRGT